MCLDYTSHSKHAVGFLYRVVVAKELSPGSPIDQTIGLVGPTYIFEPIQKWCDQIRIKSFREMTTSKHLGQIRRKL